MHVFVDYPKGSYFFGVHFFVLLLNLCSMVSLDKWRATIGCFASCRRPKSCMVMKLLYES